MNRLAIALLCTAAAGAESPVPAADSTVSDIAWKSAPSRSEVSAALPMGPKDWTEVANVYVGCELKLDGKLTGCRTLTENPLGYGFGTAAGALTLGFLANMPKVLATAPQHKRVTIRFDFQNPSQLPAPVELVDPELRLRPDAPVPAGSFPAAAVKAGYKSGLGGVERDGTEAGSLVACKVVREVPADQVFGQSALDAAQAMTLNPWQNGEPIGGSKIRLPIYTDAPGAARDTLFTR